MKERFISWRPNFKTKVLLDKVNNILQEYEAKGYVLTLRQLYYQLVIRTIVENSIQSYKRVGNMVSNARLAGYIDWRMIEDRIRVPRSNTHWDNEKEFLNSLAGSFYKSRWENIPHHIEVWCEKDAVSNILAPVCGEYDTVFLANRGYSSQSAMYRASRRFKRAFEEGREIHVFYFGDHDPSGLDMSRDIEDRLLMFAGGTYALDIQRIALNMEQIRQYNPPENPAKASDARYRYYIDNYGESSWELDALEPEVLAKLTKDAITPYIDDEAWKEAEEQEEESIIKLREVADTFDAPPPLPPPVSTEEVIKLSYPDVGNDAY